MVSFVLYHYRIMIIKLCSLSVLRSELNISAAKCAKNPERTGGRFTKYSRASKTLFTLERQFLDSQIA